MYNVHVQYTCTCTYMMIMFTHCICTCICTYMYIIHVDTCNYAYYVYMHFNQCQHTEAHTISSVSHTTYIYTCTCINYHMYSMQSFYSTPKQMNKKIHDSLPACPSLKMAIHLDNRSPANFLTSVKTNTHTIDTQSIDKNPNKKQS